MYWTLTAKLSTKCKDWIKTFSDMQSRKIYSDYPSMKATEEVWYQNKRVHQEHGSHGNQETWDSTQERNEGDPQDDN